MRAVEPFRDRPLAFASMLLAWFAKEGRHDLPWTLHPTPYRVWVSEIMLQQTQVATVVPYFNRFIERFPEVSVLAAAPEDAVLAAWTGLGYYRRARNLWRAARLLEQHHHGQLPQEPEELVKLPGIGRSTAGAIAALAFGKRAAILDGNVKRVLTRIHGIDEWPGAKSVEARLWSLAEDLTPTKDVAGYTQAIMDLGATVCTRRRPACERCPFSDECIALREQRIEQCPAPRPKRTLPERKTKMIVLEDSSGRILLQRRSRNGVWGGLWCFPECSADMTSAEFAEALLDAQLRPGCTLSGVAPPASMRHQFTHFKLTIEFAKWKAETEGGPSVQEPSPKPWSTPNATLRRSAQNLQLLDTHKLQTPGAQIQNSCEAKRETDGDYAWFAVDAAQAVGLAAPVVRYLARPSTEEESTGG